MDNIEFLISNHIEKMLEDRRKQIFDADEYIQQDNGDLVYLEKRYNTMQIPYRMKRVIDDYIACLESRDERYADLSYVAGLGDAISMLSNMGLLCGKEKIAAKAK